MSVAPDNPYAWSSQRPKHVIQRAVVAELVERLRRGQTVLLHAGRGMGKSVMLCDLEDRFHESGVRVVRIEGPTGPQLSEEVLGGLGLSVRPSFSEALAEHLRVGVRVVLLIDEIDAWVRPDLRGHTQATLEQLAKLSREVFPGQLGILVAGGVGNTLLAHSPWGSTFASRVERTVFLLPFDATEIEALAMPLATRRRLPEGWLRELSQASGGIPALACQALGAAWDDEELWPLEHLSRWITSQDGFRRGVQSSIAVEEVEGPWRLLQAINGASGGELSASDANDAVGERLAPADALRVLVSAGLVHPDYDVEADPWLVRPNPSVLHLGFPQRPRMPPIEALHVDVRQVCGELRRHAPDLFHGVGPARKLVPEATISAMMAMFFRARGWEADRELQQGAGRTDLRLHRRDLVGHAIIEVKIWGNNDYCEVTKQLASYALAESPREGSTLALIAVMIGDRSVERENFELRVSGIGARVGGEVAEWQGVVATPGGPLPIRHLLVSGLRRV